MNTTITADSETTDKAPAVAAGIDDAEDTTLKDAYRYMLALMTVNPSEAVRIQDGYGDDKLRELFGAVAGVCLGIFGNLSADVRKQVEAPIRYVLTGDMSALDALKATGGSDADLVPGQYL